MLKCIQPRASCAPVYFPKSSFNGILKARTQASSSKPVEFVDVRCWASRSHSLQDAGRPERERIDVILMTGRTCGTRRSWTQALRAQTKAASASVCAGSHIPWRRSAEICEGSFLRQTPRATPYRAVTLRQVILVPMHRRSSIMMPSDDSASDDPEGQIQKTNDGINRRAILRIGNRTRCRIGVGCPA